MVGAASSACAAVYVPPSIASWALSWALTAKLSGELSWLGSIRRNGEARDAFQPLLAPNQPLHALVNTLLWRRTYERKRMIGNFSSAEFSSTPTSS